MSSAAPKTPERMSFAQFLSFLDDRPNEKWELHDGVPVAMAGGTRTHSLLKINVAATLRSLAFARGCEAHDGDLLVRSPVDTDFAAFPDVFVRCGPLDPNAREADDPVVVVEVLSPSTMADDRGHKFKRYREMPSVRQILFVYADQKRVESWERGPRGWTLAALMREAFRFRRSMQPLPSTISMRASSLCEKPRHKHFDSRSSEPPS